MSRSSYFYKILLHIAAPLIIGLEIYLNGNQNTWLYDHLSFLRLPYNIHYQNNWWNQLLMYNLPDFCWDYSFAFALFLWRGKNAADRKYFPVIVCLLLMASEAIQIFMPGSFTFDWLDMLAAALAFSLSYFLNYV
ncbi:MAG: hypothetical protein ABI691_13865 [Ginsengibacter sp.]